VKNEITKAYPTLSPYRCCPVPYPNIIFTIYVRRQPGFFLFNVIIPGMVITFFAILTFSSPPETGERISLAIESFLSLSFLCMMVADSIPVNSDKTPLITNFLVICMTLISAALILNLVSMNLMHGSRPVPRWLHTLLLIYVGPWVGYCQNSTAQTDNYWCKFFTSEMPRKIECGLGFVIQKLQRQLTTDRKIYHGETLLKYMYPCDEICISPPADDNNNELSIQERQDMKQILERSSHVNDEKFNRDFWRCFAQTVDRVCVLTFTTSFVLVSVAMLMKGYAHQLELR